METVEITQMCARCRETMEGYKFRFDVLCERQKKVEDNIVALNDEVIPDETQEVGEFMDSIQERTGMLVSGPAYDKLMSRIRLFQEISRELERLVDYTFGEKEEMGLKMRQLACTHQQ